MIWAIIPVKPLLESKSRLAHILSAAQRAGLMRRFLQNTLAVLAQVPSIAQTLVISSDPIVLALAQSYGAETIAEERAQGLNTAVARAAQSAMQQHASGLLILPADLPFIQVGDVTTMVETRRRVNGRFMAICTDDKEDGTNALFIMPPTQFTYRYGLGSFRSHIQEATRLGLDVHIIRTPGLTFDLDTEEDWQQYQHELTVQL